MIDSFQSKGELTIGNDALAICRLSSLNADGAVDRLPFTLRVLLENLLRYEDNETVSKADIEALLKWSPTAEPSHEIAFRPARVILQDFTGVPAVVDLAAMRDAMASMGKDTKKINPLAPVELVIDHSVMVDYFGSNNAFQQNVQREYERNQERYSFLRWGQSAFDNFKVVPPGTGIVHQVNLEHLARVVFKNTTPEATWAYPDTVVGTDSHTTMINGIGVLGWGVGGIEAEAAMLGQPISMLIPQVVGFKLTGELPEGVTATDLVLTIVEMLRKEGVVGKFVEFFGEGLPTLPLADRATIANMAPEFGATCGFFPIDDEALRFMALTGRSEADIARVREYCKAQHLFHNPSEHKAEYSKVLELDMSDVVASIAGPKRPQDRIALTNAKTAFEQSTLDNNLSTSTTQAATLDGQSVDLPQGAVFIAAITSCTNTSNPAVMLAAGLLAQKARARGLSRKPWVKTSLAPGSQVVTDYLSKADVLSDLEELGFNIVGYGCTTCIGNSGPLIDGMAEAIDQGQLLSTAVLSGNRNFEGRIHPKVRNAYLASPPLVVAYALAGTMNIDLMNDPIAQDPTGNDVYLKDIWPTVQEIQETIDSFLTPQMFTERYASVFDGDTSWKAIDTPLSEQCQWDADSTYVKHPPFFEGMSAQPEPIASVKDAHVLAFLSDSVTTDHISPAGAIQADSPAGRYLEEKGIAPRDFNSYGSRRGNHEIMMRGTFANVRLKNALADGREGGWTKHIPSLEITSIYDAAMRYQAENRPLIVVAGKEYGTGSSRDWAAKGTRLLGVKAVIAESYERIHRSNLIGMGVLPLQFLPGDSALSRNIDAYGTFDIPMDNLKPGGQITVTMKADGKESTFPVQVRIDTPKELAYFENGGILHYVLRDLASA